ncbi:hypothetical protein [Streptomyces sp. Isolate_45]|uniref:hypothetical protein n=1 Tax=Streptomyces sp. Isolate_45 TaxID=2950111 RepID=UPI002481B375|nr:hypothetical protein [Streptomyces sp. Isolate_45]MDA5280911.1 hypothetical protein [Streptomyces sp. Isolate_45]
MSDSGTSKTPGSLDTPEYEAVKQLAERAVAHSLNQILERQNLPGASEVPAGGCFSAYSVVITSHE